MCVQEITMEMHRIMQLQLHKVDKWKICIFEKKCVIALLECFVMYLDIFLKQTVKHTLLIDCLFTTQTNFLYEI